MFPHPQCGATLQWTAPPPSPAGVPPWWGWGPGCISLGGASPGGGRPLSSFLASRLSRTKSTSLSGPTSQRSRGSRVGGTSTPPPSSTRRASGYTAARAPGGGSPPTGRCLCSSPIPVTHRVSARWGMSGIRSRLGRAPTLTSAPSWTRGTTATGGGRHAPTLWEASCAHATSGTRLPPSRRCAPPRRWWGTAASVSTLTSARRRGTRQGRSVTTLCMQRSLM
mmetsp:Transcript_7361/g.17996  ORF Transcript_7361/g.17996 Transcript_7361/m.17996 type:complete len:223 (-) Transcript_7361:902-1570(-)